MKEVQIRQQLLTLLGADIGIGMTDPTRRPYPMQQIEEEAVRRAVPKRVQEFSAGRHAARLALRQIDHAEVAIPQAADRAPVWPAGIAGSISHCNAICVAVVARMSRWRSLGLDIEDDTPLHRETWPIILTDAELAQLETLPRWSRKRAVKARFSIKEAVYKALYPITGEVFDFHTLEVHAREQSFTAELTRDVAQLRRGTQYTGGVFQVGSYLVSALGIRP